MLQYRHTFYYEESEKISECKTSEEVEKIHNKLFLILFKQISIYIKEIERLNKTIISLNNASFLSKSYNSINVSDSGMLKKSCIRTNSFSTNNKKKTFIEERPKNEEDNNKIINSLKNDIKMLEKQLHEKCQSEEKKKEEIFNLKKELNSYKSKDSTINIILFC